ncbi:MAG: CPBP family glutamic-type intramembrane protease [Candidatus Rokuibacteriota bacterium]
MSRPTLRRRAVVELGTLGSATTLFLALFPARPLCADMALALLALGLVWLSARETRQRFWGPVKESWTVRSFRSSGLVLALGLPVALAFGGYAVMGLDQRSAEAVLSRLFGAGFWGTIAVFVPWALVQQALFQFYLLGRLRALLPQTAPLIPVVLTGLAYGAVHLPDRELAVLTAAAGIVWSYAYQRDRVLLLIALAHALLGTTYFTWLRGTRALAGLAAAAVGAYAEVIGQ